MYVYLLCVCMHMLVQYWLSVGNKYRATAATGMNDKSSRSHSVVTIILTQSRAEEGEEMSKVSKINLIDLAGSERSSVAQTTGERLKVRTYALAFVQLVIMVMYSLCVLVSIMYMLCVF